MALRHCCRTREGGRVCRLPVCRFDSGPGGLLLQRLRGRLLWEDPEGKQAECVGPKHSAWWAVTHQFVCLLIDSGQPHFLCSKLFLFPLSLQKKPAGLFSCATYLLRWMFLSVLFLSWCVWGDCWVSCDSASKFFFFFLEPIGDQWSNYSFLFIRGKVTKTK